LVLAIVDQQAPVVAHTALTASGTGAAPAGVGLTDTSTAAATSAAPPRALTTPRTRGLSESSPDAPIIDFERFGP